MTPDWNVSVVDGRDITDALRGRLLSLRVTLAVDRADALELRIDDRPPRTRRPAHGSVLAVELGYESSGRAAMGRYTIDEVELAGPPASVAVRARAVDLRASLKGRKTRSWDAVTIAELVEDVAEEHYLKARISEAIRSIAATRHIDQTDESDMHLLTRLGEQYDAIAKQAGEYLMFVRRGEETSATGLPLQAISITPAAVRDYRVTLADRPSYARVEAHWHDVQAARRVVVSAEGGAGEAVYALPGNYADAETARQAAQAKLAALNRGTGALSLTLTPGNPRVRAETPLRLSGFREGIDGEWSATRVLHELNAGGYSTRIDAATALQP